MAALKADQEINKVFIQKDLHADAIATIIKLAKERHLVISTVPKNKLDQMTNNANHQGVALAVAAYRYATVDDLFDRAAAKDEAPFFLILDELADPHNLGSILRTADAFRADRLFLVNACADLYNPKTVRASMGAVFRCPVWACTLSVLRGLLTKSGLPLYGAALRADTVDVRRADFARCAVAIGSEGKGLSAEVLEACDLTVKIPMSDHCESLNAAAAAAVLLWEAARDD